MYIISYGLSPQSNYRIFLILIRVLGFPQSIEIDKRPDKKFRNGFIGAPTVAVRSENK